MSADSSRRTETLRGRDWSLLVAFCLVLFCFPMFISPLMGVHETIHCVNTREMLQSGDLVIPTHGDRPWLERPPLPFYLTGSLVYLTGNTQADWPYRLGSVLSGLLCVLMVTAVGTRWFGRGIGLASGYIFASMREIVTYSSQSEADIVLCLLVTLAMFLFVKCEFDEEPESPERVGFFGGRPWPVLAFFVVLGLTNTAKGLFFGMALVLAPIGCYLLLSRRWTSIRRYCWLWGWLAFFAVALPWPLLAVQRVPSIVELWKSDYLGRVDGSFMREPWWYYLVHLPWNLFPWTVVAFLGLWMTRPNRDEPNRQAGHNLDLLLWCWAIAPVLWLTVNKGKHHHYLLHIMAPWGILGALGAKRFWKWSLDCSATWRLHVGTALGIGIPACVALLILGDKVPGPKWVSLGLGVSLTLLVGTLLWAWSHPSARVSLAVTCLVFLLTFCTVKTYWDQCIHRPKYADDVAFMQRTVDRVSPGDRLFFSPRIGGLGPSWWLHYTHGRAELLHNHTFLRADDITAPAVYLIGRPVEEESLAEYGTLQRVFQSARSKHSKVPQEQWTLYRLRFHPNLQRVKRPPLTAMQATNRDVGPFLEVQPGARAEGTRP